MSSETVCDNTATPNVADESNTLEDKFAHNNEDSLATVGQTSKKKKPKRGTFDKHQNDRNKGASQHNKILDVDSPASKDTYALDEDKESAEIASQEEFEVERKKRKRKNKHDQADTTKTSSDGVLDSDQHEMKKNNKKPLQSADLGQSNEIVPQSESKPSLERRTTIKWVDEEGCGELASVYTIPNYDRSGYPVKTAIKVGLTSLQKKILIIAACVLLVLLIILLVVIFVIFFS